jgi:hypothetical protein
MKERFSNVLAWFGFGSMILLAYSVNGSVGSVDAVIVSATVWLFFGVVNYLMVGRFRLLPWVEK